MNGEFIIYYDAMMSEMRMDEVSDAILFIRLHMRGDE
jgi:hypothetical protein